LSAGYDLVTVGWLALRLTGAPFMVAVAAGARSAPLMIVGPLAGIVSVPFVPQWGAILISIHGVNRANNVTARSF
jgi:hypothetical protein